MITLKGGSTTGFTFILNEADMRRDWGDEMLISVHEHFMYAVAVAVLISAPTINSRASSS